MGEKQLRAADGIVFSVLYFLIMIVAWLSNSEIEKSLSRAHASEHELKQQRDLLEVTVEERTNELRRTQLEKLEQINHFAELGQLSSGLFHDIFNILNAVSLREEDRSDPALAHAFDTTKQIQNFMHAIRKQINHRDVEELFSLTESVEHVIQLLDHKAKKAHAKIVFDHDGTADIRYFASPFKFHQVVLNLLMNAIESYDEIPLEDKEARRVIIRLNEENSFVTLEVEDNGGGIAPEYHKKIFEQFFTTKAASKGMGIGLATIKKTVEEDFYGTITVQSEVNKESLFTVIFPSSHAPRPHSDDRQSP